jgi:predicted DNA-binding ribbon-helix-helix protein
MKSAIVKRSVIFDGHKTSVSLEGDFWNALRDIANNRDETLSRVISKINADRRFSNLSSAIRLFVLEFYREQCAQGGVALPCESTESIAPR